MEVTGLETQQIPHYENPAKKTPVMTFEILKHREKQESMEKWSFGIRFMRRNQFEQQGLTGTDINKYNIQL